MEFESYLLNFIRRVESDARINKGHLSIYMSLLFLWSRQDYSMPFEIFSREVMPIAKISSATTFHCMIRELASYGYIKYSPSFYKNKGSIVEL